MVLVMLLAIMLLTLLMYSELLLLVTRVIVFVLLLLVALSALWSVLLEVLQRQILLWLSIISSKEGSLTKEY